MQLSIAPGYHSVEGEAWDALAGHANPFVAHAFLSLLEQSGSATAGTGWQPAPILALDNGVLAGAAPGWIKSHSQGEYVFDHGWAQAWENAGGAYYPKLQIAVPFSPVPGPRLLARDDAGRAALIAGAEAVVRQNGLSSAHATFIDEADRATFERAGWLIREGLQYHWHNAGYADFEGFLAALSSRKRKAIRKERAAAQAGLVIENLRGRAIGAADWDAFWRFYQDTGARKWGRPYLTRAFFDGLVDAIGQRAMLTLARRDGRAIAGALNLIGEDCLYGRYWGAIEDVPYLHFELCYYQAIEFAISHRLSRVEAGAQGEHKLARGYLPAPTWSAHFIPHAGFRNAVADFLRRERRAIASDGEFLATLAPFRRGP